MAKSKIAQIKSEMLWEKHGPMCGNCRYFTSEIKENKNYYGAYKEEKNKRCSRGPFATGKICWCAEHEFN